MYHGIYVGKKYTRLTVKAYSHVENHHSVWLCECECGNTKLVKGAHLTRGSTKSCGCLSKELATSQAIAAKVDRRKMAKKTYANVIEICTHPASTVTVCDRWQYGADGMTGWQAFFNDVGPKPNNHMLGVVEGAKELNKNTCMWVPKAKESFLTAVKRNNTRWDKQQNKPVQSDVEAWAKRKTKHSTKKQLTYEYILSLVTTTCPLLGVELQYASYTGATPTNYATIDKIDATKGYVEGNVHVVSHRANQIKNNATYSELATVAKNLQKIASK